MAADPVTTPVVWLSTHLAATMRTLAPVARRAVDRPTRRVHDTAVRRLERLLRIAERRHSGDALAAGIDTDRLRALLEKALVEHERAEAALLAAVEAALAGDEVMRLAASYLSALEHAPTRPHPYAPHAGLAGAIAFHVDALRDRVMDTMDARHVPLPRRPGAHPRPGRWGSYLLGQMQPPGDHPAP